MNIKPRIAFLLPTTCKIPVGGYKVVFEYANRLARDGYEVSIVYAGLINFRKKSFIEKLRGIKQYLWELRDYSSRSWFYIDQRIKELHPITLYNPKDADIYIATACETAKYVATYPANKQRFYFIQDEETWSMTEEELEQTYSYPLEKIVISHWLQKKLNKNGHLCQVVPNGFDTKEYYLTIPIEEKEMKHISVLSHFGPRKDFKTALKALRIVHEKHPDISVTAFGSTPPTEDLPPWVEFHLRPSHQDHLRINNEASIYVAASYAEGWGLTIGEAMMCGQAVVCTNANGFLEMAVNERNALVSPIRDAEALAANIIKLLEDNNLRCRLARQGYEDIRQFDIEISYQKFRNVILSSKR